MFCRHCGQEIPLSAVFCTHCGGETEGGTEIKKGSQIRNWCSNCNRSNIDPNNEVCEKCGQPMTGDSIPKKPIHHDKSNFEDDFNEHNHKNDFWSFRKMITPDIIMFIFGLGTIIIIIVGLVIIINALVSDSYDNKTGQFFGGLIFICLAPLALRLYCELIIVIFRIHEGINEVNETLKSLNLHGEPSEKK